MTPTCETLRTEDVNTEFYARSINAVPKVQIYLQRVLDSRHPSAGEGAADYRRIGLSNDIFRSNGHRYWLSCPMMANIGRNIPATITPTIPPRNTIISGSIAAVMLSTASSTSRS